MATRQAAPGLAVSTPHSVHREHLPQLGRFAESAMGRLNFQDGGPYRVKVSLVQLDTQDGRYGLEATAVVEGQLVRVENRSEKVLHVVRGRARAATVGRDRNLVIDSALRRASESAFNHLCESLEGS